MFSVDHGVLMINHINALLIIVTLSQDKAPGGNNMFGSLPPKAPGHEVSVDDNAFGTRKVRSSFGRGFFKIKSNKRTASAPNLGTCSLIFQKGEKINFFPSLVHLYVHFLFSMSWLKSKQKASVDLI